MRGILRFGYHFENKDEIILRDYLAMERTRLANERTFLGYIRTSLFFLTGGITLLQIEGFSHLDWLGYLAIALCLILLITGIGRYIILSNRLHNYYKQIKTGAKKAAALEKES